MSNNVWLRHYLGVWSLPTYKLYIAMITCHIKYLIFFMY